MKTSLFLNGLELPVVLGWPEEERAQKQIVVLDIQIHFPKPPLACVTDNLVDTFCYDALVNSIKLRLAHEEFRLIEHLGHDIYQICKEHLTKNVLLGIRLTKKPAIENLTGGVSFCYGDEAYAW